MVSTVDCIDFMPPLNTAIEFPPWRFLARLPRLASRFQTVSDPLGLLAHLLRRCQGWVPGGSNHLLRIWARSPNGINRNRRNRYTTEAGLTPRSTGLRTRRPGPSSPVGEVGATGPTWVRMCISRAKANCSSGRMALRSVMALMATTCVFGRALRSK